MSVPSVWGAVETTKNYGRIGISVSVAYTDTDAIPTVEVWFWSKYRATDHNNNLYFNDGAISASTRVGSASIDTTHNSGSGWNTANQIRIYSTTLPAIKRATSRQTRYCAAKLTGVEIASGDMTHYVSYEIEPLPSYSITYNGNGAPVVGSMPANQTKWYDREIYLAQPPQLADGYTATYWLIGGTVEPQYGFGQAYNTNAPLDLYLNWAENTYTVTYNANGGVSGPDTYGVKSYTKDLEISSGAEPTRTDYNFLGWSTDPKATVATWKTGDYYTENATVTLYAVWELAYVPPTISNVMVERCDADGNHTDEGTYFDVAFDWATDEASDALGSAVYIRVFLMDGTPVFEKNFDILDLYASKGHFSLSERGVTALGNGEIDTDYNYTVSIVVMDNSYVTNSVQRTLRSIAYPIDILAKGKGISFGGPAKPEFEGRAAFNWPVTTDYIYSRLAKEMAEDSAFVIDAPVICLPSVTYEYLGCDGSNNAAFFEELVKWICENYKDVNYGTFIGGAHPNCAGFVIVSIYNTNDVDATTGLPRYCSGTYTGPVWQSSAVTYKFSTWDFIYYFSQSGLDAYPVNSIYISYSHDKPGELFGGDWMRITDSFLWGAKESESLDGVIRGASTHTLTYDEMPVHSHWGLYYDSKPITLNYGSTGYALSWSANKGAGTREIYTGDAGGDQAHNNMPPYIRVSIWRRVA